MIANGEHDHCVLVASPILMAQYNQALPTSTRSSPTTPSVIAQTYPTTTTTTYNNIHHQSSLQLTHQAKVQPLGHDYQRPANDRTAANEATIEN